MSYLRGGWGRGLGCECSCMPPSHSLAVRSQRPSSRLLSSVAFASSSGPPVYFDRLGFSPASHPRTGVCLELPQREEQEDCLPPLFLWFYSCKMRASSLLRGGGDQMAQAHFHLLLSAAVTASFSLLFTCALLGWQPVFHSVCSVF